MAHLFNSMTFLTRSAAPFVSFLVSFVSLSGERLQAEADPELDYRDQGTVIQFLKQAGGWSDAAGFQRSLIDIKLPKPGPGPEWKDAWVVLSTTYANLQRAVNNQRKLPTAILRADLLSVFERRMKVRGGGSASMTMNIRIPGQVEWLLSNLDGGETQALTDQDLLNRSVRGYPFDEAMDAGTRTELETEVRASIADLEKIEARLKPVQATRLRTGFLYFFVETWQPE